MAITETWLSPGELFSFAGFDTYNVLRTDRVKVGGGVALLLHPSLRFNSIAVDFVCKYMSLLCCDILPCNSLAHPLRCIVIYRPPNSTAYALNNLCRTLIKLIAETKHDIVILGDFNFPHCDWSTMTVHGNDAQSTKFMDTCCHLGLKQLVSFPTHLHNILDLILVRSVSSVSCVTEIVSGPPLSLCDHCCVKFELTKTDIPALPVVQPTRCFQKCNFDAANNLLNAVNWDMLFLNCVTVDEMVSCFMSVINEVIDKTVPMKIPFAHFHKPPLPRSLRRLILRKRAAWRHYKMTNKPIHRSKFIAISKKCRRASRENWAKYEDGLAKTKNRKRFYSYVYRGLHSCSHSLPDALHHGTAVATSLIDKANLLNATFVSNFSSPNVDYNYARN